MEKSFLQKKFLGVRIGELMAFIGFYCFFASAYHIALWMNRGRFDNEGNILFDPITFMDDSGLGYLLKIIITIPIWWLLFRELKAWSMKKKLLLHVLLLPFFVLVWQQLYSIFSGLFGFFYLTTGQQKSGIYIYLLCFIFYSLEFFIRINIM